MNHETTDQTAQPLALSEVLPPAPDPRALNGVTHGMVSEQVPPSEREAYAAHLLAVRQSSGAVSYLEQRLADRAALALWRLDRVARYEAAQSSAAQREARRAIEGGQTFHHAGPVTAAYERLHALTYEDAADHLADPALSEHAAGVHDGYAGKLSDWADGGSAEGRDRDAAVTLGELLGGRLLVLGVTGAVMIRAMLGRAPKRGEAHSVEDNDWIYEPEELPGLLALFRERLGEQAPAALGSFADAERRTAQTIRAAEREAVAALSDALALAALPDSKTLEKVTRYEAHLERSLYRALHDLEAARREREGQHTPGPLRGVLDEQRGDEA